ncbi:MAG: S41 family peptidase [Bacteroidota bacterium]
MKYRITFLFFLFAVGLLSAQTTPQWLRYSAISPDGKQIAFTYKGDLYRVPVDGGQAMQLTYHSAHDYMPVWSKDSKQLAFASERYGNFDIYIMDAMGGPAKRLTFHSADEAPFSFTADNKNVVFGASRLDIAEHRRFPARISQPELYMVSAQGGRVGQMMTIPAEYVAFNKAGTQMIYHDKKGGENEWRKHHTSAITRDIWTYDLSSGEHKMIINFKGEDRNPVYSADEKSIFYLSEESGNFNVHKYDMVSKKTRQVTKLKTHPVRFLSSGAGTLCFSYDGELYTMKEGGSPKKVRINIRTQAVANADKFISINGGVREMAIAPNGKEIAFIARGEVFVTSVDGSLTKRITNTPEQERFVRFGPKGKSIVYSSERDGKWHIFESKIERADEEPFFFAATLIKETPLVSNANDNYLAEFSPDGKKMAFVEGRRTIKVKDIASGAETTLLGAVDLYQMRDGDKYFKWSPDSKWLLIGWSPTLSNSEVLLMSADGKKRVNLTESGYGDYTPKWVNGGKQMIWRSNRNGLKSYATSGSSQTDVYAMFFTQDAWDKFNLNKEDYDLMKEMGKAKKKDDKKTEKKDTSKTKKTEDLKFDWDGMEDRKTRLTIHSSSLGDAVLSKDGEKLYYLARFEKGMNLWRTNLRTKETKQAIALNASFGSLAWDKDQKNLYLLSSGRISKINPETGKRTGIKIQGEMHLDAEAERKYMFDHVWIRTKAIFYEPTFHGIDWDKMRVEYEKYLPYIGNSYEFIEMISEMLGELNVSHAGGRFSRSIPNADATASLGIFMDYKHQGNGIKITEIMKGGPLDKAKFDVKAGMIVEKIDGETIAPNRDIATYLNRKASKFTLLEILDPSTNKRQQITVKPISLGQERGLLYARWVKRNAKEVEEKSNGQLGYVHIPGMSDGPYRNVYDKMLGKYADKKAMVIDTRFNGGGDLVADLAMFFTGTPFITYATEAKVVGGEPTSRWTKPTLAIYNESMYSDGHCFASAYSELGIGKTVGMPVPGTCSFAGWEGLPNGARWGVVPVSAKNKAGEWMENNQTDPQFMVKNMPGKVDKGIDQQLEKAIEELMKDIK